MKIIELYEKGMDAGEMLKVRNGSRRTDTLADAIEKGTPVELNSGEKVKISLAKNKDVPQLLRSLSDQEIKDTFYGRNPRPLITTQNQQVLIKDLKKNEMFGSTGGSGAGAAQTAMQEIAQCVMFGAIAEIKKPINNLTVTDLNKQILTKGLKHVKSDKPPKEAIDFLLENPDWMTTALVTAKKVLQTVKIDLSNYEFHRGSQLVGQIYKIFSALNRKLDGHQKFSGSDKWNPADIWIVKRGLKIPAPKEFPQLIDYNSWISQQYKNRSLIGVSLKKLGKQASAKTYNIDDNIDDILGLNLKQLLVSKTNKLFSSKDSYITYESTSPLGQYLVETNNMIQFRTFGDQDKIQGEVKGTAASHGKIGNGGVNRALKQLGLTGLRSNTGWKKLINTNAKDPSKRYSKIIDEIISLIEKSKVPSKDSIINQLRSDLKKNVIETLKDGKGNIKDDKFVSKGQAVELVTLLSRLSKKDQQAFLHSVFQYASSRSELSSVFIKVY